MAGYGSFSYYYDKLTDNAEYSRRCDYITDLLAENSVSEGILLDLACGTGTMSQLFSEKGFDVIGVDASEEMLSLAMEKNFEKDGSVLYLCQDMAELDLYGTINCAVCTLDSINHVTDGKKVKSAFEKVGLFMEKGGVFVFDVNTEYKHRSILADNTFVYDVEDVYCVWQNTLDKETARVHIELDIFVKDENDSYFRVEEEFDEVVYSHEELEAYLKKSGFEILGVYDEFTKSPLKPDSQRAVYVCKKVKQTNGFFKGIIDKIKK